MQALTVTEAAKIVFNEPILGQYLKEYFEISSYNELSARDLYSVVKDGISCGLLKQIEDDINDEDAFRVTTADEKAKKGWRIGSNGQTLVTWSNEQNFIFEALLSLDENRTLHEQDIYQ